MSDVRTMNSALVDILHIAIGWEIDAPERDQIEKIATNAIPTTAQIMIAFNSEQALKAENERLVKALDWSMRLRRHKDDWHPGDLARGKAVSEATRQQFAERQGWRIIGRPPQWRDIVWEGPPPDRRWEGCPDPTSHSDVHTALMGMSEEEWESFIIYLHKRIGFCVSAHAVMEATLKTPLSTLVECYLAATEGRKP